MNFLLVFLAGIAIFLFMGGVADILGLSRFQTSLLRVAGVGAFVLAMAWLRRDKDD